MANIYFTKNSQGYWEGTFTASGEKTVLYVHRASYGYLALGSTTNDNSLDVCVDYRDNNADSNKSFRMKYPEGVTVVIMSKIPVIEATYLIKDEDEGWIEPNPIYIINVTSNGHGTVSTSEPYVYTDGSVTLTATADEGYEFTKWSDNDTNNPRTITGIDENITLSAIFSKAIIPPATSNNYLYLQAREGGSTISMMSNLEPAPSLEYSTDGENFQTWSYTDETHDEVTVHVFDVITLSETGEKVYFRGENESFADIDREGERVSIFHLTGSFDAKGNITSLLDGSGVSTVVPDYALAEVFSNQWEGTGGLVTEDILSNITEVGVYGLAGLFRDQTALTHAGDMNKVTTLGDSALVEMFGNCTSLAHAIDFHSLTTISAIEAEPSLFRMYHDCTFNMSDDGDNFNFDFPKEHIVYNFYVAAFSLAELPDRTLVTLFGNINGFRSDYLRLEMPNGGTISLNKVGSPTVVELEYSEDGETWHTWEEVDGVRQLNFNSGQSFYITNTSSEQTRFSTSQYDYYQFSSSSEFDVDGSLLSLLCASTFEVHGAYDYSFYRLFMGSDIRTAPNLQISYIDELACSQTFCNCTSLTTVPSFELSSIGSNGCDGMFSGCTQLESITLGSTMPFFGEINNYAFTNMFENCQNLREVYFHYSSYANNALSNWLSGVAGSGDLYCPSSLTLEEGASGLPAGWTRHDID